VSYLYIRKKSGVNPEKNLGRCYPKKSQVAPYKDLGRFYGALFKSLLRVQIKRVYDRKDLFGNYTTFI
jgi:hypothetical protein